jgi:hypothetical protein
MDILFNLHKLQFLVIHVELQTNQMVLQPLLFFLKLFYTKFN